MIFKEIIWEEYGYDNQIKNGCLCCAADKDVAPPTSFLFSKKGVNSQEDNEEIKAEVYILNKMSYFIFTKYKRILCPSMYSQEKSVWISIVSRMAGLVRSPDRLPGRNVIDDGSWSIAGSRCYLLSRRLGRVVSTKQDRVSEMIRPSEQIERRIGIAPKGISRRSTRKIEKKGSTTLSFVFVGKKELRLSNVWSVLP